MDNETKRMIILDNYQKPRNNIVPDKKEEYIKLNSNNSSCIDNIDIYLKLEDNIIKDIKFSGEACVIAISSTSILTELLIGKTKEEALSILENYHNMIEEHEYNKDVIEELNVYSDIYKQPSRKTCATLASRKIGEYLEK